MSDTDMTGMDPNATAPDTSGTADAAPPSPAQAKGVICPGERAVMDQLTPGTSRYIVAMFLAYYDGAEPGGLDLILHDHPIQQTPAGDAALVALAVERGKAHGLAIVGAHYLGYRGTAMTPEEITAVGWRYIAGPTA